MTDNERDRVIELQHKGYGYKRIASVPIPFLPDRFVAVTVGTSISVLPIGESISGIVLHTKPKEKPNVLQRKSRKKHSKH